LIKFFVIFLSPQQIITIRFRIPRGHLTVVGEWAPEEGKKEETEQFCEKLLNEINTRTVT
jgi:hypothetical protein